jgi:hypothetical protein
MSAARVPMSVSLFSPILKLLLVIGIPLGLNGLVTIRGRKSGLPRTTALAIIEVDLNDPLEAAEGRRVFELHPLPSS